MSEKFRNKFRVPSARAQHWDYRWAGAYFVTICTHEHQHYFGKIRDGSMVLSNIGVLADVFWHEINNHALHVQLGEFVVMPNHIHGILILDGIDIPAIDNDPVNTTPGHQRFRNMGKNSVSSIVGSYKSAVTRHARRLGYDFKWQSRFYDTIIPDGKSFDYITQYIINNPEKWDDDKFYHV